MCPIVEEGERGEGSHKMHQEGGVSTFLKMGRGLKALFAATIFHLRVSLKCSCGSGRHCEFWLKQHSNLLNLYKWHYFLAVICGIVKVLLHLTCKIFPFLDFTFALQQSFFELIFCSWIRNGFNKKNIPLVSIHNYMKGMHMIFNGINVSGR